MLDDTGATVDANMDIRAPVLRSFSDVELEFFAWSSVDRDAVSKVRFPLRVPRTLAVGAMTKIRIVAPSGVMYSSPDLLDIGPDDLPLTEVAPSVKGVELTINIDQAAAVRDGAYDITFVVKNPPLLPIDNIWRFTILKDFEVRFDKYLPGYVFGQQSPAVISAPVAVSAAYSRDIWRGIALLFVWPFFI